MPPVTHQHVQAEWRRTYATYGRRIDDETMVVFLNDLAKYPNELVVASLKAHRLDPEFGHLPPTISRIAAQAEAMIKKRKRAQEIEKAQQAARELSPAMQREEQRIRANNLAKLRQMTTAIAQKRSMPELTEGEKHEIQSQGATRKSGHRPAPRRRV